MHAVFATDAAALSLGAADSASSMHQSIALFFAGLSFFFTGLAGVKNNLRQLTGRRFRVVMAKLTDRPVLAAAWGFGFGAVTQSATAVSFILSGLVSTGLIDVRRALPVIAASNLGTVILVYLATIDMELVILWLVGLTGVSIAFGAKGKALSVMGAMFGVGVLFFGLDMMKISFSDLPNHGAFSWMMSMSNEHDLYIFLLGIALRSIIQSSSAIAVVAVTMAKSGLISYEHSVLLVLGTGPGVAVATWLLSRKLEGVGKQIVMYQAFVNFVCGCSLAVVGSALIYTHQPFDQWVQNTPVHRVDQMVSTSYLLLQSCNFLLGIALASVAPKWLERFFPTTLEQDLSKPRHLPHQSANDPESALYFIEREQQRYFDYLPQLLDCGRRRLEGKVESHRADIKGGLLTLGSEIGSTIEDIAAQQIPRDTLDLLLTLERRQGLLDSMTENVFNLVNADLESSQNPELRSVYIAFVEGFDTMLLNARDAAVERDPEDIKLLLATTSDRGEMLERLRNSFYEDGLLDHSPQDKASLFYVSMIFERLVWLLHKYATVLESQLEADNAPSPAETNAPEPAASLR
ncbi:MAG: Na/Pi symporter [Verrucomicrobiota bacterium]